MTTTAAPKTAPIWEDFIDIFVSPSEVFTRRRGRGFFVPLLVFTVIVAALTIGTRSLMQPVYDAVWAQASAQIVKQNPQITGEQLAKARGMQEKLGPIFAVVVTPIVVLLTGLVLWLVGKLFDSEQTMGDAMMVSTYSAFPKILFFVAAALIALLVDPATITSQYSVTLGVGHFIDTAAHPILGAVVGRLDLFTIWVTVLLALGLHVTGKVPKTQAAIAAAIIWLLGMLPALLGAIRQA
ncbi:MAG TPA: YIP1 family protein [Gemmatimonadaceae bacterium]